MLDMVLSFLDDMYYISLPLVAYALLLERKPFFPKTALLTFLSVFLHALFLNYSMDALYDGKPKHVCMLFGILCLLFSYAAYAFSIAGLQEKWSDLLVLFICTMIFTTLVQTVYRWFISVFVDVGNDVPYFFLQSLLIVPVWLFAKWAKGHSFWRGMPNKMAIIYGAGTVLIDTLNLFMLAWMTDEILAGNEALVFASVTLPLIVIMLFMVGLLLNQNAHKTKAIDEIQRQSKEYYDAAAENYNDLSIMKHDLKNHMSVASQLPQSESEQYYSQLVQNLDSLPRTEWCANGTINAILTDKYVQAQRRGVVFDTDILVEEELPFENTDLSSVLANLVDNAVEASANGGTVTISIRLKSDVLAIQIKNARQGKRPSAMRFGLSTKEEPGHGWGLLSVKRIAKKYHGSFSIGYDKQVQLVVAKVILAASSSR